MVKRGRKEIAVKSISFLVTLFVLSLLILSGPAEAFTLSIDISNSVVEVGEDEVSFLVSLNIDTDERLPVEYLNLEI